MVSLIAEDSLLSLKIVSLKYIKSKCFKKDDTVNTKVIALFKNQDSNKCCSFYQCQCLGLKVFQNMKHAMNNGCKKTFINLQYIYNFKKLMVTRTTVFE